MTVTREDRLAALAQAFPDYTRGEISAALPGIERALVRARASGKPQKKRGPAPSNHFRDRALGRLYRAYQTKHGKLSVKAQARGFLSWLEKTAPGLVPRANARGRTGAGAGFKTLSNSLTHARRLESQRPALHRLAAIMRECDRLIATGSSTTDPRRNLSAKFVEGGPADLAAIVAATRLHELVRHNAVSALLDEGRDSFIRLPPKI